MSSHRFVTASSALLIVMGICASASAQTVTGTLTGILKDSSGGVIPGMEVSGKNEETGLKRMAITNAEGVYLMPFLTIVTYTLTVEVAVFKKVVKNEVLIDLNMTTVSNVDLVVASTSS